jgi:hypothetical protein
MVVPIKLAKRMRRLSAGLASWGGVDMRPHHTWLEGETAGARQSAQRSSRLASAPVPFEDVSLMMSPNAGESGSG